MRTSRSRSTRSRKPPASTVLIDVRTPEEFAARPTTARHVPMATLLADPATLAENAQYLLVCASGKRSLAAARELRKLGLSVHSLAGGLQGLKR